MASAVVAPVVAVLIVGGRFRVVVMVLVIGGAVVVWAVVIVVVIPDVDTVAAVFVAPFDLSLEVRALAVFVAFDGVVRVAASVAKVPGVGIGDARVPVKRDFCFWWRQCNRVSDSISLERLNERGELRKSASRGARQRAPVKRFYENLALVAGAKEDGNSLEVFAVVAASVMVAAVVAAVVAGVMVAAVMAGVAVVHVAVVGRCVVVARGRLQVRAGRDDGGRGRAGGGLSLVGQDAGRILLIVSAHGGRVVWLVVLTVRGHLAGRLGHLIVRLVRQRGGRVGHQVDGNAPKRVIAEGILAVEGVKLVLVHRGAIS